MPSAIYPDASQDAVAVFNSEFQQVFADARPLNARVRPRAHVLDHPLENGEPVSDHKVIMPVEIDLMLMAVSENYRDVYAEITGLYATSELLMVQTRASTYENMVIAEMPHEERPELFDILPITLRLRSIKFVEPESSYAPKDETRADTKSLGEQSAAGSVTVQPDSGAKLAASTGTANNFFQPSSDYITGGLATTTQPQMVISGDQAATIQTGAR